MAELLDGKEPDGIDKRTWASVASGKSYGKYAEDINRQVTWSDLPHKTA